MTPHQLKFYHEISALAVFTTCAVTSPTEVLNPSKSSMRVGIDFFQTPINVAISTSSHESQMFLMIFRMMNPFQKTFNLHLPDHQMNHCLWQLET